MCQLTRVCDVYPRLSMLSRLSRLSARVMAGAGARVLIREGAGAPAPSILTNISSVRFDKVFAWKCGLRLQKYWHVDPVLAKINFTHFLTWPALIRALEEWRNFKFGTTQWSGALDKFKVLRFYVLPSREPFQPCQKLLNECWIWIFNLILQSNFLTHLHI